MDLSSTRSTKSPLPSPSQSISFMLKQHVFFRDVIVSRIYLLSLAQSAFWCRFHIPILTFKLNCASSKKERQADVIMRVSWCLALLPSAFQAVVAQDLSTARLDNLELAYFRNLLDGNPAVFDIIIPDGWTNATVLIPPMPPWASTIPRPAGASSPRPRADSAIS